MHPILCDKQESWLPCTLRGVRGEGSHRGEHGKVLSISEGTGKPWEVLCIFQKTSRISQTAALKVKFGGAFSLTPASTTLLLVRKQTPQRRPLLAQTDAVKVFTPQAPWI